MADVLLTPEAAKEFDALREPIRRRVVGLLERLADWPNVSGAKPLSGRLAGRWRMRTGDHRLQFHVSGESVVVEKIGNRDRFYED